MKAVTVYKMFIQVTFFNILQFTFFSKLRIILYDNKDVIFKNLVNIITHGKKNDYFEIVYENKRNPNEINVKDKFKCIMKMDGNLKINVFSIYFSQAGDSTGAQ